MLVTPPEYCHYHTSLYGDRLAPAEWIVRLAVRKPGPLADSVREIGVCARHLAVAGRMGTVVAIRPVFDPPAL